MDFYSLRIPREHVYEILAILGSSSVAQIIDPKPAEFHKPFLNYIKRCEEALNKLEGIARKARENNLELRHIEDTSRYLDELSRGRKFLTQCYKSGAGAR